MKEEEKSCTHKWQLNSSGIAQNAFVPGAPWLLEFEYSPNLLIRSVEISQLWLVVSKN